MINTIVEKNFRLLVKAMNEAELKKEDIIYLGREDNYVIAIYFK